MVIGLSAVVLSAAYVVRGSAEDAALEEYFKQQAAEAARAFDKVPKEQLEAWKKKYAFQSLRGRLAYEKSAEQPAPRLSEATTERLKEEERNRASYESSSRRTISLMMLHGANVDKFVKSPGFGFSRMAPPGPSYLQEDAEEVPIPLATVAPLPQRHASPLIPAPPPAHAPPSDAPTNRWKMPPADEVLGYHRSMAQYFTWFDRIGYFQSVDQVAGFKPHAVLYKTPAPVDIAKLPSGDRNAVGWSEDDKRWKVARMELVSLLKHATPRVYLSENLPRMDELSSVKTRAVTAFETAGLEKLVSGDDLHASSTPNRIEMLGSLRASKQCRQCHVVPHGALLGAFSYELRRDPPIRVEKEKLAPLQ